MVVVVFADVVGRSKPTNALDDDDAEDENGTAEKAEIVVVVVVETDPPPAPAPAEATMFPPLLLLVATMFDLARTFDSTDAAFDEEVPIPRIMMMITMVVVVKVGMISTGVGVGCGDRTVTKKICNNGFDGFQK